MRVFLQYVLPLLLPTLVYVAYMANRRSRAAKAGDEVPDWLTGPIYWYVLAGGLLLVGSFAFLFFKEDGGVGDGVYQPPRVEDGKVIDGGFKPKSAVPGTTAPKPAD